MASRTHQMLVTIVTRFAGKSVNFIVFAIVTRSLSLLELGIYGFIFTMTLIFATFFDVGLRNSVANFIGKEEARTSDFAAQALLLFVPFGLCAALALPVLLQAQGFDVSLSVVAVPAVLNVLALLFIRMQQGVLLGVGDIAYFNNTELASRIALLAGTLAVLVVHEITLATALWVLALSNLVGALSVARGVIPLAKGGTLTDLGPAGRLIRRGFLFMLGVVAMLVAKQTAFLIITQLGSEGQAGLFYGLLRLSEILTEIGLAVAVVLFSANVRAASREQAIADAAHSTRIAFTFFIVLALVAAVLAPVLVPLTLGADFAGYDTLFRVLLLGTLLGTIWTILLPSLSAIDSPIVTFLIFVPNLLFGSALIWWAFVTGGLQGAAMAMVVTQALLSASFLTVFKLRFGSSVRDFVLLKKSDLTSITKKFSGKQRRD